VGNCFTKDHLEASRKRRHMRTQYSIHLWYLKLPQINRKHIITGFKLRVLELREVRPLKAGVTVRIPEYWNSEPKWLRLAPAPGTCWVGISLSLYLTTEIQGVPKTLCSVRDNKALRNVQKPSNTKNKNVDKKWLQLDGLKRSCLRMSERWDRGFKVHREMDYTGVLSLSYCPT
jgi:hypothetical protein